jgi:hypothetical protein
MGNPCKLHYPATKVDYHLLGLVWNSKLYFDTKIPLGLRTGAMAALELSCSIGPHTLNPMNIARSSHIQMW